jgi:NAD+ synthase (glutamine-hydrolysing)
LQWAEKELEYPVLQHVNVQQPTAELRPQKDHQTDEEDLMPYATLTAIERLAIYEMKSPVEVYQAMKNKTADTSLLKKHIRIFFQKWSANQWKRERLAPSFFIDDFNVDPRTWCRFPILSGSFKEELAQLDDI